MIPNEMSTRLVSVISKYCHSLIIDCKMSISEHKLRNPEGCAYYYLYLYCALAHCEPIFAAYYKNRLL